MKPLMAMASNLRLHLGARCPKSSMMGASLQNKKFAKNTLVLFSFFFFFVFSFPHHFLLFTGQHDEGPRVGITLSDSYYDDENYDNITGSAANAGTANTANTGDNNKTVLGKPQRSRTRGKRFFSFFSSFFFLSLPTDLLTSFPSPGLPQLITTMHFLARCQEKKWAKGKVTSFLFLFHFASCNLFLFVLLLSRKINMRLSFS